VSDEENLFSSSISDLLWIPLPQERDRNDTQKHLGFALVRWKASNSTARRFLSPIKTIGTQTTRPQERDRNDCQFDFSAGCDAGASMGIQIGIHVLTLAISFCNDK
jgi:hypothetical protein